MKLFDPRAALAEIQKQPMTPATSATPATQHAKPAPHVANVASVAAPREQNRKAPGAEQASLPEDCKHGFALGNRSKTWTGKVVSLADWRMLSEWDKHGPDGQHWNGTTKTWEQPK